MSRRTAYWRPEIKKRLLAGEGQAVAMRSRQGVWIAALWHFPRPKSLNRPKDQRSVNRPSAVARENRTPNRFFHGICET